MRGAKSSSARAQGERPGAGRPTRAQAEQRQRYLLECALDEFVGRGYDRATMESIAAATGMTKRTIYARYVDKAALFRAAVTRAIEDYAVDGPGLRSFETADLAETLKAVALWRVETVVSPDGVRLQRILNSESYRFPDVVQLAYDRGTRPIVEFLNEVMIKHGIAVDIDSVDPPILATSFMTLVVGGPAQAALRGATMVPSTEEWVTMAVRIFLDGARSL
jgi:TetR/AcrR family transcriptional regulator, mexJK operon transcriptional repressor